MRREEKSIGGMRREKTSFEQLKELSKGEKT